MRATKLMIRKYAKLIVIVLAATATVAIAILRVQPYISSERESVSSQAKEIRGPLPDQFLAPEYDEQTLKHGLEEVLVSVREATEQRLRSLPPDTRPNQADLIRLAQACTKYVELNRTGTLQDLLDEYKRRGVTPRPELTQDDRERAERAWAYSTAWARHRTVNTDSIEIVPVFVYGKSVGSLWTGGGPIKSRKMPNGKFLHDDAFGYSVYEMRVSAVVPSFDGKAEFPVVVSIMFINDGEHGDWSPIKTAYREIPDGQRMSIPYP